MKLLFIFPQDVIPAVDGGKISIYYSLVTLAKYCDVYVFFPIKIDESVSDVREKYSKIGLNAFPYVHNTDDSFKDIFFNVFSAVPFKFKKYFNKNSLNLLDSIIVNNRIDQVMINHAHMAEYGIYIKNKYRVPVFLREHNIEYQLVEEYVYYAPTVVHKLLALWQLSKTKRVEKKYWGNFDHTFFISDSDYELALSDQPDVQEKTSVLYDGCPYSNLKVNSCYSDAVTFLFSGSVNTLQNKISLIWFYKNIWSVREVSALGRLLISGNNAEQISNLLGISINELEKHNIEIVGFVEDYSQLLLNSTFLVSPTVIGSGVRIKILEAVSLGTPVLLTSKDLNMLSSLKDRENVLLFDSSESFVEQVNWALGADNYDLLQRNIDSLKYRLSWENYYQEFMYVRNSFLNRI